MGREPQMRQQGPLVIAGDEEDWDAEVGDPNEWLEGLVSQARDHPGPVEDVATVDDQVHLAPEGWLEGGGVVREEIVPTPAPFDPRPHRQIEAEV